MTNNKPHLRYTGGKCRVYDVGNVRTTRHKDPFTAASAWCRARNSAVR